MRVGLPHWKKHNDEKLIQLWNAGVATRDIIRLFDNRYTRHAILGRIHRLREAGHELAIRTTAHGVARKHRKILPDDNLGKRILEMWRSGMKVKDIADSVGIANYDSVYGAIARMREKYALNKNPLQNKKLPDKKCAVWDCNYLGWGKFCFQHGGLHVANSKAVQKTRAA